MRIFLTIIWILFSITSCNSKSNNEPLKLSLNIENSNLTSKNNELIRDFRPDKIGYDVKLTIKNVSNKEFKFDMWSCSFHHFLTTNTLNAKIFGPQRCDSNFISEIVLQPNQIIEYNFILTKDQNLNEIQTNELKNVKVGLTEIHTNWNLEKGVIDQAEEQFKKMNKKIFWSNSVNIE